MTHIKRLVMHGFKSFAKRTEVPFEQTLNVIIGPNGAGKSNISDAICFVLGRLSIKSMRASRASNLIHNGGKGGSPAEEAFVEMVLENRNRTFPIDKEEVSISRTVRKNGNSLYKIDDVAKTRQEVLELLAQAGIDPNGFNIILQQEISRFIEMHPEERRQIIEQVAGISIYEEKKHKSLNELARTEEKLKEVNTILRERSSYLDNLEKDRKEALNYETLSKSIKRDKAALLFRQFEEKKKEQESIVQKMSEKEASLVKLKTNVAEMDARRSNLTKEVDEINLHIEKSSGIEQDHLHKEISEEKVEVASLSVRLENFNQQLIDLDKRKGQLEEEIHKNLADMKRLKESLPKEDVKKLLGSKTESFSSIEEKKTQLDKLRGELSTVKNTIQNKKHHYSYIVQGINSLHAKIAELEQKYPKNEVSVEQVLSDIKKHSSELEKLQKRKHDVVGEIAGHKKEISLLEKMKKDIQDLDSCPVCLRKVTKDHITTVHSNADETIQKLRKKLEESLSFHANAEKQLTELTNKLESLNKEEGEIKLVLLNERNLQDRMNEKKKMEEERDVLMKDISSLEKKVTNLELEIKKYSTLEKTYENLKEELKDMSKMKDESEKMLLEITLKEKDVERMHLIIKKSHSEREELKATIADLEQKISEKQKLLNENEIKEKKIYEQFQKLFKKRNQSQDSLRDLEQKLMDQKFNLNGLENDLNILRVTKAKIDAEADTLTTEFEQYKELDIESLKLKQSKGEIEQRIKKNEESVIRIGSVNMKALEVYDKVKEEYDKITEKVQKLESEKNEILNIIASIDKKKKGSFLKVFEDLNQGFTRNILALAGKEGFLDLENKQSPFEGGVDIGLKLGKGKYLDISSLSGGERTMAALSLIFAIQELKPYYFYIFDEIDAALDKRNSERLGTLLKTYIKNAQYIVITHNDSLISDSPVLFGVSMQEGKSKVLSLKI